MNNISIKQRIYRVAYAVIGFASLVAVTLIVTQLFIVSYTKRTDAAAQGVRIMNRSEMNYAYYIGALRGYILDPEKKQYRKDVKDYNEKARVDLSEALKETDDQLIHDLAKKVIEDDKAMDPIEDRIFESLEKGDQKSAEKILTEEHIPIVEKLVADLTEVRKRFAAERDAAISSREKAAMIDYLLMALILISSTVAITIYSFRLAKVVSEALEKISDELAGAAGTVRNVSGSVSTASQALSETTTQQAAAIEETVSSMEEMSSMLSQTSQNSQTTLELSEEGQQEGERGKAVIAKMLTAMDEIHSSNERLESIVKLIEEIQSKTKVINDIVFETRLLSFNASIEAARAGAHGKGFAVVAEEVGKLAAMSGKAAEEIRTLLESSTAEVSSVVRGTQERVNAGRQVSQDCQSVFEVMSSSLEKIGESVRMITAATKEQEQGVKQTNQAMSEMDQVTQRNSSSAEALASQAGHLSQGANALIGSVDKLRSVIFGSNAPVSRNNEAHFESALPLSQPVEPKFSKAVVTAGNEATKANEFDRNDSRWKAA